MRRLVNMETEETVVPIEQILKEIGIPFSHVCLRSNGFEVVRSGGLSFVQLEELSRIFETKDIDLLREIDRELEHNEIIIVKNAKREA